MNDPFCRNPWDWLDVTVWFQDRIKLGWCICSWAGNAAELAWLPCDTLAERGVASLWNSPELVEIRRQWQSGVADPCKQCPRLCEGVGPPGERADIQSARYKSLECDGPRTLNLAYDRTCNLACKSCRPEPLRCNPGSRRHAELMRFQEQFIKPALATAERAFLAGQGDPFGSPAYWSLLSTLTPEQAPRLQWHVQTNGQGFTKENYDAIPTRTQIDSVQFSVDAASGDTYRAIRGGDWRRLLANMSTVAWLRSVGAIDQWTISMVVQTANWREMPAFLALGKDLGCDAVIFNMLLEMGGLIGPQYRTAAVHLPGHPEHAGFRDTLASVRATESPKVITEFPRE